jgi:hypothetical protein
MTDEYRNQWDGSRDPDERFVQQGADFRAPLYLGIVLTEFL